LRSLQEARELARSYQKRLLDGGDPLRERQQAATDRAMQQATDAKAMTFEQCATALIAAHEASWRSAEHRAQWINSLETYVHPIIGKLPVAQIDVALVVKVLEPIWRDKPETASRVRGRIERVLAWAQVRGFRNGGDNPARWRGHLAELFPARSKVSAGKHHAALPYAELPDFMAKLRRRDHIAARALEFTILTAARAGEVLGATWDEIDVANKVWTIPASRMKGGKEHRVPLSERAIDLLGEPREERIFALGHHAMWRVLAELHGAGATVHGFRSSFRDWAAERTAFPNDVIEMSLAHAVGNKVEQSYRRTDLFDKRRKLMEQWAAFCSRPEATGGKVVTLGR
jgi:integrase